MADDAAVDEEYVVKLLDEAREEVLRADQKAGVVLFVLGIGLGALLAGLIRGDWTPVERGTLFVVLWWLGSIILLGAVVASALAVWPRLRSAPVSNDIMYWGDVSRTESPAELASRLEGQETDSTDRLVEELWHLSRIVMQKYQLIRAGLLLAAVGFVLHVVAALFDYLT